MALESRRDAVGSRHRLVYPLLGTMKLLGFLAKLGVIKDSVQIRYDYEKNILQDMKLRK
jgi:hypothetical protein